MSEEAMTETSAGGRRLLVVDDEPDIVELLSASLRYAGFEVAGATSGRQALTEARRFRPELILLDVMMPDLDGFEVVKRLRGDGARTPVLFLTARDATEDKIHGLTLGGDDYVTKPFSLAEVIARIEAVLRRVDERAGGEAKGARVTFADIELDADTHEVWKAGRAGAAVADRVQAAAVPDGERRPGAVQGPDPRPRVALRLRRRRRRGRVVRVVPAQEGRHHRAAADPHAARGRLHDAAAAGR